jgi:hypothetical protein
VLHLDNQKADVWHGLLTTVILPLPLLPLLPNLPCAAVQVLLLMLAGMLLRAWRQVPYVGFIVAPIVSAVSEISMHKHTCSIYPTELHAIGELRGLCVC